MATFRLSPTEVQVDDVVCVFKNAHDADEFESCVATVEMKYCELEIPQIDKRYAEPDPRNPINSL